MKPLLNDERFKHVDLYKTDLKETFARIRREQAQADKARIEAEKSNVRQLKGKRA